MNTAHPNARLFPTLALVVWPAPASPAKIAAPSPPPRPSLFPTLASVRWEGTLHLRA